MARSTHHHHANTGIFEERQSLVDPTRTWKTYEGWCGQNGSEPNDWSGDPTLMATCPDCGKKWGKAQREALGKRIRTEALTPEELPGWIKSGVRVFVDGVHRAYVITEHGWGKGWSIRTIAKKDDTWYKGIGGLLGEPDRYKSKGETKDGTPIRPLHRSARDAAIAIVPELVLGGFLPTPEEQAAADQAKLDRRQQEDDERQQRTKQRQDDRLEAIETLRSLQERAQVLGLTNADLSGLVAIEKFL